MAIVNVRRRKDGVPQIGREDGTLPPGERYVVMATSFFISFGLFLSGLAPFLLVLGILGACTIGESLLLLDAAAQRTRPVAEVHDLSEARWQHRR